MIRRRLFAVAAGAVLATGIGLSTAMPASAATLPLPFCSTTAPVTPSVVTGFVPSTPTVAANCWYLPEGAIESFGSAAGYLGANDNHTRYRFVQANFTVTPQFTNLNGTGHPGAVGVEECDPNISFAAQFGVIPDPTQGGAEVPFYAEGFWGTNVGDPCINNLPLVPNPTVAQCPLGGNGNPVTDKVGVSPIFCGSFAPLSTGDQLGQFAIYYTPGLTHHHQVSFGFCNISKDYCRQAYARQPVNLNFWEIGVGVFSGVQALSAPPTIPIVAFSQVGMNCYSCSPGPRPMSVIQPVNPSLSGGLEEVADYNGSAQGVLSPDNTIFQSSSTGSSFTVYNGSTS